MTMNRYGIALNGVSFMGMMLDHGDHLGPEFAPDNQFKERWIRASEAEIVEQRIEKLLSILNKVLDILPKPVIPNSVAAKIYRDLQEEINAL